MKITDKFPNGVAKIAVVWILSVFLIQLVTTTTMILFHLRKTFNVHLSPEQQSQDYIAFGIQILLVVFICLVFMGVGAYVISVKSRKWVK